jgi:hypothetical protein
MLVSFSAGGRIVTERPVALLWNLRQNHSKNALLGARHFDQ